MILKLNITHQILSNRRISTTKIGAIYRKMLITILNLIIFSYYKINNTYF